MDSILWKYVKPLKSKNAVRAFLKKNSIELPECLIFMIESNNGGRPSSRVFTVYDGTEHVFKSMLSYNEDDFEPIYCVFDEVFSNTSLFPIGSDPAGNFICYDMEKHKYSLWYHETNITEEIIQAPFLPLNKDQG